jgi:hypothetical protein
LIGGVDLDQRSEPHRSEVVLVPQLLSRTLRVDVAPGPTAASGPVAGLDDLTEQTQRISTSRPGRARK